MSLATEQGRNSFIQLWSSSERRALTGLSNLCDPEGLHGASRAQQSRGPPSRWMTKKGNQRGGQRKKKA